jgi:hypothetical protein
MGSNCHTFKKIFEYLGDNFNSFGDLNLDIFLFFGIFIEFPGINF